MKTIGITGGTGFVGQHLAALLAGKGYHVSILTRKMDHKKNNPAYSYIHWDAEKQECDTVALKELHAVVHLAGSGIADKRWTSKRKWEIVDSRVKGTAFLIRQLIQYAPHCKTFVSASAIGFYGADNGGSVPFTEDAPAASGFLGETCSQWEAEAQRANEFATTFILRFGIVLGKESGAYPKLAKPLSYGIMAVPGSGRQVVSWIAITDLARLILFVLEHGALHGTYNAVAPKPVTQLQLMKTIAEVKGGVSVTIPVPAFLLKTVLGEMSEEALKSCTVSAQKIMDAGFTFNYPDIKSAVKALM